MTSPLRCTRRVVLGGLAAVLAVAPSLGLAQLSTTAHAQATPTPAGAPSTERVLYQADWSGGLAGWTGTEDWSVQNGVLMKQGQTTWDSTFAPPFQPDTNNYAAEAEIAVLDTLGGVALVARGSDGGEYKAGMYEGAAMITAADPFSPLARQTFNAGTGWHTYRVEARGDTLRLLIDGNVVLERQDNTHTSGRHVGLWATRSEANVRNFRVLALP